MLLQQASRYETMLNASLIERIAEEARFQAIIRLQGIVWNKSDEVFGATFDRMRIQQLLAMAESVTAESQSKAPTTS